MFKQTQKTENMKKLFFVLVIAATFAACNSETKEGTTETAAPATTETAAPSTTDTAAPASTDAPATTATTAQ